MNELERLKVELERVQKQAAALRGALERLCNSWAAGTERENYEAMKEAKAAISSDAGRDYISREQVKPLVECTQDLLHNNGGPTQSESAQFHGREDDLVLVQMIDFKRLETEFKHARTLGL